MHALLLALALVGDDGLFLAETNPTSHRSAVLEEKKGVAYLYLTKPGITQPAGDVVVYSTGHLGTSDEALKVGQEGGPPPLTSEAASAEAIVKGAAEKDFAFRWKQKGDGVVLLRNGKPIAMVVLVDGKPLGYSRALEKQGFYGHPWDQKLFESHFPR
jgi:hypothetical protein